MTSIAADRTPLSPAINAAASETAKTPPRTAPSVERPTIR